MARRTNASGNEEQQGVVAQGPELFVGEASSTNIGAARGERSLGRVSGPGLYFFVGANAGGKSTELNLLMAAQDAGLLRRRANISDGASEAEFVLGPLRMTFRRSPGGAIAEPQVEGVEALPLVTALPASIETLITGDGLKGEEERARRRLGALLSYAPIDATAELAEALCLTLEGRRWPASLRAAFDELAAEAKGSVGRFKPAPYATAAQIREALLAQPRRGILDDHGWLLEQLNALGNTGEKAADRQRAKVASLDGRLEEIVTGAQRRLGRGEDPLDEVRLDLGRTYDLPQLENAHQAARMAAERARTAVASRRAEQERREALQATHGERPDSGPAFRALDSARLASLRANEALTALEKDVAPAQMASAAGEARIAAGEIVAERRAAFGLVAERLQVRVADGSVEDVDFEAASVALHALREAWTPFAAAREEDRQCSEAVRAHQVSIVAARDDVRQKQVSLLEAQRVVDEREELARRWDAVSEQLALPLPGTDSAQAEEFAEAEALANLSLAREARVYRELLAERDREQTLLEELVLASGDYRSAAKDSWTCLGAAVTEELRLPWLQVDGLRIFVGYTADGQLNTDLERIQRAQLQASVLQSPEVNLAGVSLQRFVLERVRQLSNVDWRDLDDSVRLSTGELHEACLEVLLSRRGRLGGIVVIPWVVLAALDAAKLGAFAAKLRAAGLIAFSERPSRGGDPSEITLEKVEEVSSGG